MKLGEPSKPTQAELELNSLIEQQKSKEASAQAELEKLKQKLNKDIEIMHRDMAVNSVGTRSAFIQEGSKNFINDAAAKFSNWFSRSEPPKGGAPKGEGAKGEAPKGDAPKGEEPKGEAREGQPPKDPKGEEKNEPAKDATKPEESSELSITGTLSKLLDWPSDDSKDEASDDGIEILAQANAPVSSKKPLVALSAKAEAKTAPVTSVPSFVQIDTNDPAQVALDKAEADLRKLQQQLREQTLSLSNFGKK